MIAVATSRFDRWLLARRCGRSCSGGRSDENARYLGRVVGGRVRGRCVRGSCGRKVAVLTKLNSFNDAPSWPRARSIQYRDQRATGRERTKHKHADNDDWYTGTRGLNGGALARHTSTTRHAKAVSGRASGAHHVRSKAALSRRAAPIGLRLSSAGQMQPDGS